MLNNIEMTEVLKRTAIAINCTMRWLSDDKKEDLKQIVAMQVMNYQPTEAFPDPIPCIEFLKTIAVRQAYKAKNEIIIREKEVSKVEKILADLNLDGEESKYVSTFQTFSFDELQEAVGFEPECHRLNPEEAMIEAQENAINQQQVNNVITSPLYPGYLQLAILHFNRGGNTKTFAASLGMSGQSAINRLKKMVREANDTEKPMLPFEAVADSTVACVPAIPTKKQTKKPVTVTNDDQLTLFYRNSKIIG